MSNLDYNHQEFISNFERHLQSEGFHLKKSFDDSDKGGRFFKDGHKNKAFGRYKFVDGALTSSGNPLIMWTVFGLVDKAGKLLTSASTNYYWYESKEKPNRKSKPKHDENAYKKAVADRAKREQELQKQFRKNAFDEYKLLKDSSADPNQHPYLTKKGVKAGNGLIICNQDIKIGSYYNEFKTNYADKDFYYIKKGDLLIPAMNLDLEFVTYQRITDQGVKLQRIDISTVGAFYCLGDWRTSTKRIYLCEGYATGYSLFQATDGVVFVCFDVHNIGVVLKLLKIKYPHIEIIICTDNDRKKSTKVGLYKGFEYSYMYNSPFTFPVFPEGEMFSSLSDWNDLSKIIDYSKILQMCENQIKYFYENGKNHCIERVAKKNGISGSDLKLYSKNNELLFKTMDLSSF